MKNVYFITSNEGKLLEAKEKLSVLNIRVIQKNLGYPEIQSNSLEEVATFGLEHLQKKIDTPFILEDAGLFIDALGGFPGVYSSYVFYTIGCEGILNLLKNLKNRKAIFRSVFAYGASGEMPRLFIGECTGKIAYKKLGEHGFGYDPIFIPDGKTQTFAQMDVKEKNSSSHRGKSLGKLLEFLINNK